MALARVILYYRPLALCVLCKRNMKHPVRAQSALHHPSPNQRNGLRPAAGNHGPCFISLARGGGEEGWALLACYYYSIPVPEARRRCRRAKLSSYSLYRIQLNSRLTFERKGAGWNGVCGRLVPDAADRPAQLPPHMFLFYFLFALPCFCCALGSGVGNVGIESAEFRRCLNLVGGGGRRAPAHPIHHDHPFGLNPGTG